MVVENLGLTAEQRARVQDIVVAMQQYVDGHLNEPVERRNFRRRRQQPGDMEAAKKQRGEITGSSHEATLNRTQVHQSARRSCPGCGATFTQVGGDSAPPTT
jgi:hypothetical protein